MSADQLGRSASAGAPSVRFPDTAVNARADALLPERAQRDGVHPLAEFVDTRPAMDDRTSGEVIS